MLNVVFTGPAFDSAGQSILRANLIAACEPTMHVQHSMSKDTNLLVASRTDTVKAKMAVQRGIKVMSYPEFLARYLVGVEIPTEGVPNKFTDKIDTDLLVPVFLSNEQLEKIDVL